MPAKARIEGSAARLAEKAARRDEREQLLAARIRALPTRKYGVIYADPEWRFEPRSRRTGLDRAADNHYPTSELDVIMARPVQDIAARDCILFLWATAPMMPQALEVMRSWGFQYKTQVAWVKHRLGTGYWFRNRHELLLVGTRGSVPAPSPGRQWPSVIVAPAERHSQKPEEAAVMIECMFPRLPKIELNRRGAPRDGWDAWGFEADQEEHDGPQAERQEP
jgi:N6-adenosine-specific RNA methylase IME4